MTVHVTLGLGTNLGDREFNLVSAVRHIQQIADVTICEVSPIYETKPVGTVNQPDFFNIIVTIETTLEPKVLLRALQKIENDHGRVRDPNDQNAARTLDIDIIDFNGITCDEPELMLPHPRAAQRAFVLVPWMSIEPDATLDGKKIVELLPLVETSDVRLIKEFNR